MNITVPYSEEIEKILAERGVMFSYCENDSKVTHLTAMIPNNRFKSNVSVNNDFLLAIFPLFIEYSLPISLIKGISKNIYANSGNREIILSSYGSDTDNLHAISYNELEKIKISNKEYTLSGSQKNYFGFEPEYGVMIYDDDKTPLGFISYNRIHFFFNLFSKNPLLKWQINLLNHSIKMFIRMNEQLKPLFDAYRMKLQIQTMQNLFTSRIRGTIKSHEDAIANYELNIDRIIKELNQMYEKMHKTLIIKESLENQISHFDKNVENELRRFIDEIGDFTIGEKGMEIITDVITINDIEIGQFKITILIDDYTASRFNGGVIVENLWGRIDDCDHPHIRLGNFCLGNMASEISKLRAECKFVELVLLIKQFLFFYNPNSAYRHPTAWKNQIRKNIGG